MNHLTAVFNIAKKLWAAFLTPRYEDLSDSLHPDPKALSAIFWSAFIGVAFLENGKLNLFGSLIDLKSKLEMTFDILKKAMRRYWRRRPMKSALNEKRRFAGIEYASYRAPPLQQ